MEAGKRRVSLIRDGDQFFGRGLTLEETPALRGANLICPLSISIMRAQLRLVKLRISSHGEVLGTGDLLAKSLKVLMNKDEFVLEFDLLFQELS